MCGLTGFWDLRRPPPEAARLIISPMLSSLHHRGPDDQGTFYDPVAGCALGLARLAIIDLSPSGHQPMVSRSGRLILAFNGELYNFRELREQLQASGSNFSGRSDTEVVLEAIERWGLPRALERFNGMFAFSLWDREAQSLQLARDRFGEKPLYFGWLEHALVFGSELKALRSHPGFRADVDRAALAEYMRHKYIPAPRSIYSNIRKLLPGTFVTFRAPRWGEIPEATVYWSLADALEHAAAEPFVGDEVEAAEALEELLSDSVRLRMYSDVPMGAFLSGGIDSSTVVALMQANATSPVRTFTIGSDEFGFDEAVEARGVARHLGTQHTEFSITAREAREVIPELPMIFDEPFADSSQIPTLLVSRLAARDVTVSLSGDGGDEVFGGYNRYFWIPRLWARVGPLPVSLRRVAADVLIRVPPRALDQVARRLGSLLPGEVALRPGDKAQKLAGVIGLDSPELMYGALVSHWRDPTEVVLDGSGESAVQSSLMETAPSDRSLVERMMFVDALTYLPDDILAKVDRASMAASLEARVPMLDHRVVEFAWRLPLSMKVRDGLGKQVLRRVLSKYVPEDLVTRPKSGFGVPIGSWLRGPLRPWAEELLDQRRLRREGFLDAAVVSRAWREHVSGRRSRQYQIWDVLMFQAWLEAETQRPAPTRAQTG